MNENEKNPDLELFKQAFSETGPAPTGPVTLPLSAESPPSIPGYELFELLGSGGMGAVYRARQLATGRIIAIKVMKREFAENAEFIQRFVIEGQNARKLQHENIVSALDCGQAGGVAYLAMEFIQGRSLASLLEERKRLPEGQALDLIRQVALGLQAAWELRIIHRDIKPENILVTPEGKAKLCDLGLSRTVGKDVRLTQTGFLHCTPPYASPEHARGERDLDTRTDIYSLGVTLYHSATGYLPFTGDSPSSILVKHATEVPIPPITRNPELSSGINRLVLQMMEKSREARPATPGEVAKAIEELQKEAVRSAGFDPLESLRKKAREKFDQGKFEEVEKFLRVVLKDKPDDREAKALIAQIPDLVKSREILRMLKDAQDALQARNFPLAIELAQNARQLDSASSKDADEILRRANEGKKRSLSLRIRLVGLSAAAVLLVGCGLYVVYLTSVTANRNRVSAGDKCLLEGKWSDAQREYSSAGTTGIDIPDRDRKLGLAQSLMLVAAKEAAAPTDAIASYRAFAAQYPSEPCISAVKARMDTLERAEYDRRLENARQLLEGRDYPEALKVATAATRLSPARKEAIDLLAQIERISLEAQFQESLKAATQALSRKEFRIATRAAEQARALKPESPQPAELLKQASEGAFLELMTAAQTLLKDKKWKSAVDGATQALLLNPGNSEALELKRTAEAEEKRARMAEFGTLLGKAKEAFRIQDYRAAIRDAQSALEILPNDADGVELLAKARKELAYKDSLTKAQQCEQVEDWKESIAAYKTALDVKPGDSEAQKGLEKVRLQAARDPRMWKLRTLSEPDHQTKCLSFSWDGRFLASGGEDKLITIRDTKSGEKIKTLAGSLYHIDTVSFSPDGAQMTSSEQGMLRIWDIATGNEVHKIDSGAWSAVAAHYSANGQFLVSAMATVFSHTGATVWESRTGRKLRHIPYQAGIGSQVTISSDGTQVAMTNAHEEVELWSTENGSLIRTLRGKIEGNSYGFAFSGDGRIFAVGGMNRVRLWTTHNGEPTITIGGLPGWVSKVALSFDGKVLVTAAEGGEIALWSTGTGKALGTHRGFGRKIDLLLFSFDGTQLAAIGDSGAVKIWSKPGD